MNLRRIFNNRYYSAGILGLCAAVALGSYLLASDGVFRIGYPLDDAWIHQTYARNLGETGSWAFIPGQISAGSTAPGWTLLLAIGYWVNLNAYFWTYLLGWAVLWLLSLTATYGFRMLLPQHADLGILAGLLVIFEWHLTWAAGSGMETLLSGLIALAVLLWMISLSDQSAHGINHLGWQWLGLGLLVGLSVWVRPDGITLLGVVGLTLIMTNVDIITKLRSGLILGAGFLLAAIPYLLFNLVLAGEIFPNTFYAKQAEYAILRSFPLWDRFFNLIRQPLTGVGIVLLPGLFWFGTETLRKRKWAQAFSTLWILGYLILYTIRLPVTYQHGRYIMPVIPAFCLFGLVGMVLLVELLTEQNFGRIIKNAWIIITAVILLAFWILGLRAYAMDVAVIESEMVDIAQWVEKNTEGESLVAAHDIGALGYYADRNLLDLAGLVSPEVIPFIRDETALRNHIDKEGANYLVTFPGWYPNLVQSAGIIYQTNGVFSPMMGGENMGVYDWMPP
jgi:hypothetical protein